MADVLECTDMQPTEGIGVVREVATTMVARGRGSCKSLPTPTLIFFLIYYYYYYYYFLTTYSCSNGNITQWRSYKQFRPIKDQTPFLLLSKKQKKRANDIMIIKNAQKLTFPSEDKKIYTNL
jgi:hypothetical protein